MNNAATPENPAALALLAEIEAWVRSTKCTSGDLGAMVFRHPGFVPQLRKRGWLNPDTATVIRAFMSEFPDVSALPGKLRAALKAEANTGWPWRPDRHAEMMRRLKLSLDEPLATAPVKPTKPRISAVVIRAAKLDGRDLPTFVNALIDMGMECWRDDRLAHGETVA